MIDFRSWTLRQWIGACVLLLAGLLVAGYITNDQFAALLDRLIPFGAMAT